MKKYGRTIIMGIAMLVMTMGIAYACNAFRASEEARVEALALKPNQIGYTVTLSENGGRYTSYLLLTPRGFERCEGDKNRHHSINVYMSKGLYGKELMPLDKAIEFLNNYRY